MRAAKGRRSLIRQGIPCLILIIVNTLSSAQGTSVFGTISGYDVGGSDPLCFVSNLANNNSLGDDGSNEYVNIDTLNNDLYSGAQRARLLPQVGFGQRAARTGDMICAVTHCTLAPCLLVLRYTVLQRNSAGFDTPEFGT
jgi:hypothetical protein